MPLTDMAFLLGPLFGIILGPIALIAIVVLALRKHLTWALWTGVTLLFALIVSTGIYWAVWGRLFNYADSGRAAPSGLQITSNVAMSVAAFACGCLLVSALLVGRARPR